MHGFSQIDYIIQMAALHSLSWEIVGEGEQLQYNGCTLTAGLNTMNTRLYI